MDNHGYRDSFSCGFHSFCHDARKKENEDCFKDNLLGVIREEAITVI